MRATTIVQRALICSIATDTDCRRRELGLGNRSRMVWAGLRRARSPPPSCRYLIETHNNGWLIEIRATAHHERRSTKRQLGLPCQSQTTFKEAGRNTSLHHGAVSRSRSARLRSAVPAGPAVPLLMVPCSVVLFRFRVLGSLSPDSSRWAHRHSNFGSGGRDASGGPIASPGLPGVAPPAGIEPATIGLEVHCSLR
jgi:hypothetical protein